MKSILLSTLFLACTLSLLAQDKKELKKISKTHGESQTGKIYAKAESVAILGTNLRFRLGARAVETTSNRDATTTKFESFATVEGVEEALLQEITDEYYAMVTKRFEALGMSVISYDEIQKAKAFEKLVEKGSREKENVVSSWGVAQIFTPKNQDYITWNNAGPFGPHQKVAKELKTILYSSLTTVDFCFITMTAKSSAGISGNYRNVYTEGSASVIPAINIHGYSYPLRGLKMMEDNTYGFGYNDKGKSHTTMFTGNISSTIDYATKVEKCASCEPSFARKFKLMSHGLGTVVITADPVKFKEAVLDALTIYLDQVFMLYEVQKQ